MTYIFIDTNVCLHFTQFNQYPWKQQFSEESDICIVVTHPLIDELDKKKYTGLTHLKQRAMNALKVIEKIATNEINTEIKYYLFNENIDREFLSNLSLDYNDGDDKMIGAIVKFKNTISSADKIFFVSNDLGPRLKAGKFNIQSVIPDTKHQLESQLDEMEKAIRQLKIENEKLKNLSPKLSVSFKDQAKIHIDKIFINNQNREQFIQSGLLKNEKEYPRFKLKAEIELERDKQKSIQLENVDDFKSIQRMSDAFKSMRSPIFDVREEDKEKYNEELGIYRYEFQTYLDKLFDYKILKALTIEINLELNNLGTNPAEDIDIYIHFPDGFELFNLDDYPPEPSAPETPYKPKSAFDTNFYIPTFPNLRHSGSIVPEKPNVSKPSIKKSNSYDVDIKVRTLKHNKVANLNTMFVVFKSYDSIINFKIDYELRCSNVPEVIKGDLNVVVEKMTAYNNR